MDATEPCGRIEAWHGRADAQNFFYRHNFTIDITPSQEEKISRNDSKESDN